MALNFPDKVRGERGRRGDRSQAWKIHSTGWRFGAAILGVLTALGGARSASTQTNPTGEYQVKAAFLFHFAQFVDWPEGTFKDAGSPLTYCTIGEDPFHGALGASLNGKTIEARAVRVQHIKQAQQIQGCQILFIGAAENRQIPEVLTALKGTPVLTVGEAEHFARNGGVIGFLQEENKIRFEINLEAAEHAKLKVSSRLLALAKTVIGSQRET